MGKDIIIRLPPVHSERVDWGLTPEQELTIEQEKFAELILRTNGATELIGSYLVRGLSDSVQGAAKSVQSTLDQIVPSMYDGTYEDRENAFQYFSAERIFVLACKAVDWSDAPPEPLVILTGGEWPGSESFEEVRGTL